MPRSSSPRSKSSTSHLPVPKPKPSSVVPFHPTVPTTSPTLGQSMKDGFGLGLGSGIGHMVINRMFGPSYPVHPQPPPQNSQKEPCEFERKVFENCILNKGEVCHNEQLSLTECLKLSK
jgi:hypothetical protein